MEKVRVLIQDFVRTMESPIQQIIYLRDIVEIARKKDRMLQVLQTRMPEGDKGTFERRLRDRMTHFYGSDLHIASVERCGVVLWCVGTGPHIRHSFDTLVRAVEDLEHPDDVVELGDPENYSP